MNRKMRPDVIEYKNKVVDLLEGYNYAYLIETFDRDTVIRITKDLIIDGFIYQDSVHRCAVEIMATFMISKQEVNRFKDLITKISLQNFNTKGTKLQ